MFDFDYKAPTEVGEVVALLNEADGKAKVLAGGTDLIVQLREGLRQAELLIDVKKIPALLKMYISPQEGFWLGAAVPCFQIHGTPILTEMYAGLADATRIIGGWQIQSRASVGGNLCNASPAADSIPILIAYDAVCHIAGPAGEREMPVLDFCVAPGKNALEPGEILVNLVLPPQPPHSGAHYLRFIPRNEMDIAVVGVGAWVQLDDAGATILAARVGLGAVAPTPVYAKAASDFLVGQPATVETFVKAGELAKQSARPISDMRGPADYRLHLVGVLTKRTLVGAVARARGQEIPGYHIPGQ